MIAVKLLELSGAKADDHAKETQKVSSFAGGKKKEGPEGSREVKEQGFAHGMDAWQAWDYWSPDCTQSLGSQCPQLWLLGAERPYRGPSLNHEKVTRLYFGGTKNSR